MNQLLTDPIFGTLWDDTRDNVATWQGEHCRAWDVTQQWLHHAQNANCSVLCY